MSPFVFTIAVKIGQAKTMFLGLIFILIGEACRSYTGAVGLFVGTAIILVTVQSGSNEENLSQSERRSSEGGTL